MQKMQLDEGKAEEIKIVESYQTYPRLSKLVLIKKLFQKLVYSALYTFVAILSTMSTNFNSA